MLQKKTAIAIATFFTLTIGVLFGYQNCAQNGFESTDFASNGDSVNLAHRLTNSATTTNHIQYFGYYASAFENVGRGDYTADIKDHANLTWIVVGDVVKKLREAKELNMHAIIDVQWYFMDADYHLRPDMIASWKKIAKAIEPYRDHIAAFYPADEPYMNAEKKGRSDSEMQNNLETIASVVKSTFPEIPVAVIFASKEVKKSKPIPAGFDWIGFDCYGKFNDCSGGHSVTYYHDKLKARLSGTQRMMLIPWGYKEGYPSGKDIYDRNNAAAQYWNMAINDPLVVAVIPFLYQTYTDSSGKHMAGTQDMPALLQSFRQMGIQVKRSQAGGIKRLPLTSPNHDIAGNIDGVATAGKEAWTINGWACARGLNKSISVDLYAGGGAGAGGVFVSRTTANLASENGVATVCRATGTMYRFKIPVDLKLAKKYGGKRIYVHGISPVGGINFALTASGAFSIPTVAQANNGKSQTTNTHSVTPIRLCGKQNVSPTYCQVNYYCNGHKVSSTKTSLYDGTYVDYNNVAYSNGAILTTFTIPGYEMKRAYYQFRCQNGVWVANDPNNRNNWCEVNKALPSSDARCGGHPAPPPPVSSATKKPAAASSSSSGPRRNDDRIDIIKSRLERK
jgi:hypothetical protein